MEIFLKVPQRSKLQAHLEASLTGWSPKTDVLESIAFGLKPSARARSVMGSLLNQLRTAMGEGFSLMFVSLVLQSPSLTLTILICSRDIDDRNQRLAELLDRDHHDIFESPGVDRHSAKVVTQPFLVHQEHVR